MGKKGAIRAVSLLWAGSLLGAGFAFLTQVAIARMLGPAELGTFASALAVAALMVPAVGFGISQFWLNVFGQEGWGGIRWCRASYELILLNFLLVSTVVIVVSVFSLNQGWGRFVLLLMLLHVVGQVAIELLGSRNQLEEEYGRLAYWQLVPHGVRLTVLIILYFVSYSQLSAFGVAVIYGVVGLASLVIVFDKIKGVGRGDVELKGHGNRPSVLSSNGEMSNPRILDVVRGAWPFGLAALFQLIYHQSNVILIDGMLGPESAGLYNVAFTVMNAVYLFPTVIYQRYLYPKIQRWATHNPNLMYVVFKRGNFAMLLLGVIASGCVWLGASSGIGLLFGKKFTGAVDILCILSLSAPFLFVAFSAGAPLATKDCMRKKVLIMGFVAVFNLIANYVGIKLYGVLGAAYVSVISNFLLMALYWIFSKRLVFS